MQQGYRRVVLVHADKLAEIQRPFDRIVVTARSNDIDPNWWRLLAPEGRIVVPLDIGYGGERAIGFVRSGDRLRKRRVLRVRVRGVARQRDGAEWAKVFPYARRPLRS